MKTKIYRGRDLIGRFTCDGRKFTPFQRFVFKTARLTKRILLVLAAMSVIGWPAYGAFQYAKATIAPQIVEAEVIKEVPVSVIPPVMERIAKCESGGTHYKNGQVIFNANSNTVDIGKYQINSIWNRKASEMKLDLTKEKDNEAFAMYLYQNFGTEPWYASKACWNK